MKTLVSALILSATLMGSAYAGELDYPPGLDTQSSLTRVQVQQELAAARANGELVSGEEGYPATAYACRRQDPRPGAARAGCRPCARPDRKR